MKHALWLRLLARLTADAAPLTVIDTHAGAGLYDLQDPMARTSREACAGIGRLMADEAAPTSFALLKAAVRRNNPADGLRFYPGSPVLSVGALRGVDRYEGCELRAEDQSALQVTLSEIGSVYPARARAIHADGYERLRQTTRSDKRRLAVLIDPPFERGDEYAKVIAGVEQVLAPYPDATIAIWAPIKDLETLDAFLRGLEAICPRTLLVAEARLRPLLDPMRMNGSAMILIGAPDLLEDAQSICEWVVRACGEAGGRALVRKLGVPAERPARLDAG